MGISLSDSGIGTVKGIGQQRAKLFARLGIDTVHDLLYYLPSRYEDRSNFSSISDLKPLNHGTVRGKIVSVDVTRLRRNRFEILEVAVTDGTGFVSGKWFNQRFLKKNFRVGQEIVISGIVKVSNFRSGGIEIENPEYEQVSSDGDDGIHTGRIVPIYRVTQGISGKQFRRIMFGVINEYGDNIRDTIPDYINRKCGLPDLVSSLRLLHFPDGSVPLHLLNASGTAYHKKIAFNEFFLLELGVALLRKDSRQLRGVSFSGKGHLRQEFLKKLPFTLTGAQQKAIDEILNDMAGVQPMHRLIQGDVGCGKTVVAVMAMLRAVECGFQAVLMAPTEILAEQHYFTIRNLIGNLSVKSALVTGGAHVRPLEEIASGEMPIVIGTHAVIQESIVFKKLGLAVIDEQHKFGVMQRSLLRKKGINPDILIMTATPIPRSLALTVYGNLDCTVINELPPHRKPVITKLFSADRKKEIYELLYGELRRGKQAYVVYPVIEESEQFKLKSAVQGKIAFQNKFPGFKVELLHGRLNAAEREQIMNAFKNKEISILVCTTVIEVGVDMPDATVMVIVHAERFGLAQLHQLRGRVGRGDEGSYCILISYGARGGDADLRHDVMVKYSDGFRIAEEDLVLRGPGDFLGTKQSGMPEMKFADLIRDREMLEIARREAFDLLEASPELTEYPSLKKAVEVFWKGKAHIFRTG